MNKRDIVDAVIAKIHLAQQEKTDYNVFFEQVDPDRYFHEFLFFMKPEITSGPSLHQLQLLLEKMLDTMALYDLHMRDARILSAAYLREYNIIAQHYGVINALSLNAKENLSPLATEKFNTVFDVPAGSVRLMGSLEFLKHFPSYDPDSLNVLWQTSQVFKLGSGTYCAKIQPDGEDIYLVNGFHPRQLAHYTNPGNCIVAFTLAGSLDWHTARNRFIGLTNPAEAQSGSLRSELYLNREAYGLKTVSASLNGFHLSAGPVEGLVELIRYNSDHNKGDVRQIADFVFGRTLLQYFAPEQINRLISNRILRYKGKEISTFDLTEEMNSDHALQLIRECMAG